MILRLSRCLLLAAVALYYTLVVFNNLTDYNSNNLFIHHVLSMDTTFPGNRGLWRALTSARWQELFYWTIIAWEAATGLLCWWGCARLITQLRAPAAAFDARKDIAVAALTLGLLQWFTAFLTVGGEWFLMWQSSLWNGQQEAFRMFACLALVLLFVTQREPDLTSVT
jgi:predicted small integral membrane protein